MTLVNNFCCCNKKEKKPVDYPPGYIKKDGPPIQGSSHPTFDCNDCNKMGLFTEIDYTFGIETSNMKDLNIACQCKSNRGIRPLLTQQGRSCACLIRPAIQKAKCGPGCIRPDRCGCNNKVPKGEKYRLCACSVKEHTGPDIAEINKHFMPWKRTRFLHKTNYEA